jgi:hypothetical protein
MARDPDGVLRDVAPDDEPPLNRLERELARGLEQVLDGALERYRRGDPFVYGIHQALSPAMIAALVSRYRAAGGDEARITPGPTGASVLLLRAAPR